MFPNLGAHILSATFEISFAPIWVETKKVWANTCLWFAKNEYLLMALKEITDLGVYVCVEYKNAIRIVKTTQLKKHITNWMKSAKKKHKICD